MKNFIKFYFALVIALVFSQNAQATVRRVNNNAGITGPNIYTTIQAAHDAAVAGDTLAVEPSATDYGSLIATKQLFIYGNGYFLTNPNLQANTNPSPVTNITLNANTSGTTITGLGINTVTVSSGLTNINVTRNYIVNVVLVGTANSINITQNYFYNGANAYAISSTTPNNQHSIVVRNNIFYRGVSLTANTSGVFENNTLWGQSLGCCIAATGYVFEMYNFQVRNNIIARTFVGNCGCGNTAIVFNANNNSPIENNIGTATQFPAGNGNVLNATGILVATGSTDTYFQLAPGSPAVGAGVGGVNCGAYGGNDPYRTSGVPALPSIYQLTVPSSTTTNTLNVIISTRSNN